MANKYLLKPVLKTIKEGFTLVDENDNLVYEGRMTKFSLFKAAPYEFTNHVTNKKEEHKIGKTVTAEESGVSGMFSTSSYFKYDGEKIWHYLHDKGIRIDSNFYRNGKMWYRAAAGEFPDDTRVYRNAGKYKIFINSFPDLGLPQSNLYVADTKTGKVYKRSVLHNMGDFRRDLAELVEWLSAGNEMPQ